MATNFIPSVSWHPAHALLPVNPSVGDWVRPHDGWTWRPWCEVYAVGVTWNRRRWFEARYPDGSAWRQYVDEHPHNFRFAEARREAPSAAEVEAEIDRIERDPPPCLEDAACQCSTCREYDWLWARLDHLNETGCGPGCGGER